MYYFSWSLVTNDRKLVYFTQTPNPYGKSPEQWGKPLNVNLG